MEARVGEASGRQGDFVFINKNSTRPFRVFADEFNMT